MSDIGGVLAKAFTLGYETGRKYALFPVAEPAATATQSAGGDCFDVCEGHSAPAEPAEEETQAEGFCSFCGWSRDACARGEGDCAPAEPPEGVMQGESHMNKMIRKGALAKFLERTLITDDGWRLPTGWDPGVLAGAIVCGVTVTGSSAIPAPTETEWPRIEDIPNDVRARAMDAERNWARHGSGWRSIETDVWIGGPVWKKHQPSRDWANQFAPFVAIGGAS